MQIRSAHPDERLRVLRLTLASSGQSPAAVERQVESFMAYAAAMKLDLSHHWIAEECGVWRAACTCVESPGRSAMLFLPPGLHDAGAAVIGALVSVVRRFAVARGIRLLQCLLEPSAGSPEPMVAAGLRCLARLDYLERPSALSDGMYRRPREAEELGWDTYAAARHGLFAQTIASTYADSRDCPALNGIRDIEDVIAGHQAATRFDPERWFVLRRGGEAVGCILLGEIPLRSALEVVYMGVTRGARGAGLGQALLTRGVEVARRAGLRTLTLAVDASNAPACALYHRFGFVRTLGRDAWIDVLTDPAE